MKKLALLIIFVIFVNLVSAQEVRVVKESSDEIKFNDVLEVTISISNPYSIEKEYEITERIPQGILLVDPKEPDKIEVYNGIQVRFFKWSVGVPAGNIATINYKIKSTQLGEYTISPTQVKDKSNNNMFLSQSLYFSVICDPNGKCEEGESYLTCPQDCKSGDEDGVCVNLADNVCDPDCSDDPDCKSLFGRTLLIILFIILLFVLFFIIVKRIKSKGQTEQKSL